MRAKLQRTYVLHMVSMVIIYMVNMVIVYMVSTVSIVYVYMVSTVSIVYVYMVNTVNTMYMTRYLLMAVSPTALNRTVLSTRMFSGAST